MKCTSCKEGKLKPDHLEDRIRCHTCDTCGGNFLLLEDYLVWRGRDGRSFKETDALFSDIEIDESKQALLCPMTGSIMIKYKISKDTEHRLDLSSSINGVWMDKGEWELLKAQGLALSLSTIFTEPWQRKIKLSNTEDVLSGKYAHSFGEENYTKLKEFKTWLDSQQERSLMLAYLISENPYSVKG